MTAYKQPFDAKAYWATKPLCSVCKNHKVKNGTICYECKKTMNKEDEIKNTNQPQIKTDDTDKPIVEESTKISQIKFDKKFIKTLLDKLKVGNTRSIHLNALPGRSATRLDLEQLANIDQDMPSNFIETILNNEAFSFPISYDKVELGEIDEDEKKKLVLISKRLNTLVIEKIDNFLEFGLKNFGFGYPI